MALWNHQLEAIKESEKHNNFGLFFEPGLGKTRTAIEILLRKMQAEGRMLRVLILAPPIVLHNWKNEFLKYTDMDEGLITVLTGPNPARLKTICKLTPGREARIYVTNYEALLNVPLYDKIREWAPEMIIFDELHRLKGNSKRTKASIPLADAAKYRLGLTGTPILNSALDIFFQYRVLDGGKLFSKNYHVFKASYFADNNRNMPRHIYFPNWQPRQDKYPELTSKIYSIARQAKKSECLDLPPLVKKDFVVELSSEQKKIYKQMADDCITFFNSKAVTAELAITKLLRLQQIASGFVKDDDGVETALNENPKATALNQILEDIVYEHKVIIWAVFKFDYKTIRGVCEKLKLKYVEITGDTPVTKRFELVNQFETDPETRVIIGHPGSMGEGVNLTASSYSVYFSRNFNLGHYLQSEARNYRGGSEKHESITHINIVAKETVDERTLLALNNKQNVSRAILDYLNINGGINGIDTVDQSE